MPNSAVSWTEKKCLRNIYRDAKISAFDSLLGGDYFLRTWDDLMICLTHLNSATMHLLPQDFLFWWVAIAGCCPLEHSSQWLMPSNMTSGTHRHGSCSHGDQKNIAATPVSPGCARPSACVLHRWDGAMQPVGHTPHHLSWLCALKFPSDTMSEPAWKLALPQDMTPALLYFTEQNQNWGNEGGLTHPGSSKGGCMHCWPTTLRNEQSERKSCLDETTQNCLGSLL